MSKNYFFKSALTALAFLVGGSLSAQYCTSSAGSQFDTEIDEVTFTGQTMNISFNSASTCAQYTDNTGTDTADVVLGSSYTMTTTLGTCGFSQYTKTGKVFIDWNGDFDFDDPGETVGLMSVFNWGVTPTAETFTINVPATATPGFTRMRVVCQETWQTSNVGPCNSYFYGETEDYTIFVRGYANDGGIADLVSPSFPSCAMDSTVKVSLMNSGNNALTSATINWSVNGTLQTPYSFTGSLASLAIDTVTLGTVSGGLNDGDNLVIWLSMANGFSPDSNTANDTLSQILFNSLNGVYTIDPTAGQGDFNSFTEAITAAQDFGICGPTIFEAVDSSYIEQLDLMNYNGMSDTNTITFRSQSGNPAGVVLSYSSTATADNYVVRMFGADNFKFEDMTISNLGSSYSYGVSMWDADNISFDNCTIVSSGGTSWNGNGIRAYYYNNGAYASCHNFNVTNCTFDGGYYNLYFYNDGNDPATGAVIENNSFTNGYYYGAYSAYAVNLQFNNNHVKSNSTNSFGYAIYFSRVKGGSVMNNYVEGSSNWPRYGMYCYYTEGDLSTFMPIVGNRISMPNSSANYGIYVNNNLFVEYAHNSVYMDGGSSCRGFYCYNGGYNKIFNNNVVVTGTNATAMYLSGTSIYQSDYNNLSAVNGNIGYAGGAQATLADWQMATGFDSNSINVNSPYSDTTSLKVCTDSLYGMGKSLPMYAHDYEGDARQTMPCIGADEFMPIALFGFNSNPVLCDGDTLVLVQDYYDTVVWNTVDTGNTYAITAPGSQSVAVYDGCGSDTSNFVVDAQVMAHIGDTNLCEGTSAVLGTGLSNGTYLWSNGSTDSTIMVDSAQVVSVEVIDVHGCTSADTAYVTQSYDVVLPDSTTFCEGSSVVLDANMTGTYLWSDGSTNQTLAVSASGTYSVTVTDQNCVSSATSNVTEILDAIPSFTDSSSYLTVVFTNTSQNATSYLWDFGDGTTSTVEHPTHVYPWTGADSINYVVTLSAFNSCGSDDFINDGVRVGQLVSVSEIELANMISVYPNPSNGQFNVAINAAEAGELSIEVVDVRGTMVYNQSFGMINGDVSRQINLENAAQGIYFVQVTLGNETAVYRISVQ